MGSLGSKEKRKITLVIATVKKLSSTQNLLNHISFIYQTMSTSFRSVDIIVFPEYCYDESPVNEDLNLQFLEGAQTLAQKFHLHLVICLPLKDGEQWYNTAVLIDPEGQIICRHRKFKVGVETQSVPSISSSDIQCGTWGFIPHLGPICMMVCADIDDPTFMENTFENYSGNDDFAMVICPTLMEDEEHLLSREDVKTRVNISNLSLQIIMENIPKKFKRLLVVVSDQPTDYNKTGAIGSSVVLNVKDGETIQFAQSDVYTENYLLVTYDLDLCSIIEEEDIPLTSDVQNLSKDTEGN